MSHLVPYRGSYPAFGRNLPLFRGDPFRFFFGDEESSFRTSLRETEDAYVLEAELPGVARDSLTVEIEGGVLTISATYGSETDEGDYILSEKRRGTFTRSFMLSGIEEEGIRAEYRDGVLRVTLPRSDQSISRGKKIDIE